MNDWTKDINWTRTDADIGREVGLTRFRISQIRVMETGLTSRGREIKPPEDFAPERSVEKTAKKYGVCNHIARRWHKSLDLIKSIGRMPEDFAPVWKIHQNATAAKYGVSTPTVNKWLKQYESKTNEPK
jgi:hypothetical protein